MGCDIVETGIVNDVTPALEGPARNAKALPVWHSAPAGSALDPD